MPDWQKLQIAKGTIVQWVIFMPEECADLLQFRVEYHGHQLLPYNTDEWMSGFFYPTSIAEKTEIDAAPYELDVYAFNDDDSYEHEYNIYVNVEPEKPVVFTEETTPSWWDEFKAWLGVE